MERSSTAAMRALIGLAVLAMVTGPTRAAPPMPSGVHRIASGSGGAASADGTRFAYWADDGRIAIRDPATGKDVAHILPKGSGWGRLQFSPDGTRLAYVLDGWMTVADVATTAETELGRCGGEFAFDRAGLVHWIDGDVVRTEGRSAAIKLPVERTPRDQGGYRRPIQHMFGRFVPTGDRMVVMSCGGSPNSAPGCSTLWATDAIGGAIRELYRSTRDVVSAPVLAPSHDRVCYFGRGLHCAATDGSGAVEVATGNLIGGWGHVGYEWAMPFSPDGRRLVYRVSEGKEVVVVIHDLATGKPAARHRIPSAYQDVGFWGDATLLLFEGWFHGSGRSPALAALAIASGKRSDLVLDRTEYTAPTFVPGRTDVLYIGRERDATRDLVEVRLARRR